MWETDIVELERVEEFVAGFREDFRRRDQVRWAGIYLQGLLSPCDRKTVGGIARHVILPPDMVVEDVAQALQNFVNQSPWDELKLWRRYRSLMHSIFAEEGGTFVLEDLAFLKQGRHSVGVQRQYSAALNCKTNCQIAVALSYLGRNGACPLSLRLYLPRAWLTSLPRLVAASVPEEHRAPQTKATIALDLLDEARAEGWPAREVIAGAGFAGDPDFQQAVKDRDLLLAPTSHYDQSGDTLRQLRATLINDLGLDHFEGRSWRGFHHHACLVMLAFGYRALEQAAGSRETSAAI